MRIYQRWTGKELGEFEGATLREAVCAAIANCVDLSDANLRGANLSGANLSGADLSDANLRGANLSGANLSGADLSDANLSDADLSDADLSDADLRSANLSSANLRGANLMRTSLAHADLSSADLSDADLSDADLRGADLSDADLPERLAFMPDPNLKEKIRATLANGDAQLEMETWHTCATTHCLAGWAITLHPDGPALEAASTPYLAGRLLLGLDAQEANIFFAHNDTARAWLEAT